MMTRTIQRGQWLGIGLLLLGIGEAIMAHHYLLVKDEVVRDERFTMPYIIIFLFVWIVAMIIGMVTYEL